MKNNQSFLTRIFSHNIVLLVLAFLLSFSAWLMIKANDDTDTTTVIKNVPVTIELPEAAENNGLKLFKGGEEKVNVTVKGSRIVLANLTESSIKVTSKQVSKMTSAGSYTLDLSATPSSLVANFGIVSIEPSTIECFVDTELEKKDVPIENNISVELKDKSKSDSLSVDVVMTPNVVTYIGPETQVSQIASVAVEDTINSVDANYENTFTEKLKFYDVEGKELDNLDLVKKDVDEIEVRVSVLPIKTVDLAVSPINGPTKGAPAIDISPKTVKIAGKTDDLNAIENDTLIIGSLDFSKLANTKVEETYNIKVPDNCKLVTNKNEESNKTATVSADLSSYSKTTVTAKISNRIDATAYTAEFATNTVDITICGPAEQLESISSAGITAIADFTGLLDNIKNNAVSLSVPLTISLSSEYADCWVYGSYTANVNISRKE